MNALDEMNLSILSDKCNLEVEAEYTEFQSDFQPLDHNENTISTSNNDDITINQTIN